jgi:hypothetical protein
LMPIIGRHHWECGGYVIPACLSPVLSLFRILQDFSLICPQTSYLFCKGFVFSTFFVVFSFMPNK